MAGKTIKIISDDFKSYFASGKYIFLFNLLERITFFAFYISIARYVDKDLYGFIVTVFTFTNIVATIFDLGIPFYIQRESATNEKAKIILEYSIFIKLISIFILLPLPFAYFRSAFEYWDIILLVSLVNFFSPLNQILIFYLNGKYLFAENFFAILLARIPYFLILIIITLFQVDVRFSLMLILFSIVVQNLILTKKANYNYSILFRGNIHFKFALNLIKKSYPFGLGIIFVMIYDRIDVLLIQRLLSNESVAIYSVAYSIYRNSSILSGIFLSKFYNDCSKFFLINRKIDQETFLSTFKILLLLSMILILIFNLFGASLIKFFFTSRFIYSAQVLGIVSFALPFIFLNNLTGVTLNSIHKEKITMISTFIGMVVNISVNLYLIPKVGILGAVISTIITEWIILIIQLFAIIFYNRNLGNV